MRTNDEPAFPVPYPYDGEKTGMTLLDYFAGQALAGLLASGLPHHGTADLAYQYAYQMLEERLKRKVEKEKNNAT